MLTRTSSSSLIQQSPEPTVQASSESSLCSECLTTLAPGITHNCSPSTAVLNMIFLAISLGSLQAEQVAAGLLKNKMDKENIQKGEVFLLSTGGNKLQVQVGCSDNKSKRKSVNQISLQLVKELQIVLELSLNKTSQLISTLRRGMGSRGAVESNIFLKLNQLEESISHYYNVVKVRALNIFCRKNLSNIIILRTECFFPHSKFKPTHSRYKRMEEHPEHGERLLFSVLSFNGRRIC